MLSTSTDKSPEHPDAKVAAAPSESVVSNLADLSNAPRVVAPAEAEADAESNATLEPAASQTSAGSTTPAKAPSKTRPRSRWLIITGSAIAVIVLTLLAWRFTRPPAVAVMAVKFAPLVRTLQFSARVATTSRAEIGSTITGRVERVLVLEGAAVKQGEALIYFESDELRAAVAQARAAEYQASARLAGLRSTGRSVADASVVQAESVATKALADLRRTQDLTQNGFLSQSRLDDAKSAAAVAEALRLSASAQSAANRGTEVTQAQAQLAAAHAAREAAQARLGQSVVVAPADARVLTRLVEPGQIVQPGRALFSLALVSPLQLVAQVDERYLEQLQPGQPASVIADAFPAERFAARMNLIAPVVDAQRGAIQVKLSVIEHAPAFLREDMTLSVEVETARRAQALVVPIAALRGDESANLSTVMIFLDGHARTRKVRVGIRTLKAAEIIEGLSEGDIVLVSATVKADSRMRPKWPASPSTDDLNANKIKSSKAVKTESTKP